MVEPEVIQKIAYRGLFLAQKLMEASSSSFGSLSNMNRKNNVTGTTVVITAIAGLAVAAAIGGALVYSRRSPWAWRRKRRPLSPQQWSRAFSPDGRLVDGGLKVLKIVRSGGIDSRIRAEVWPFLLGVYDLMSSKRERDLERIRMRAEYEKLRQQCEFLQSEQDSDETNGEVIDCSVEEKRPGSEQDNAVAASAEDVGKSSGSVFIESESTDKKGSKLLDPLPTGNNSQRTDEASSDCESIVEDDSVMVKYDLSDEDSHRESEDHLDGEPTDEYNLIPVKSSVNVNDGHTQDGKSSDIEVKFDRIKSLKERGPKALEDFSTWQRIIRLDAVRMNAEWIPYSPSQANVSEEEALVLGCHVGLKNDEHLEPCRKHHAARLVAILETYALYDSEIGYCQGMSDLLSPFVALMDDDYEAFWCFVHFMRIARDNFRLDESGIRRQLEIVAKIIKAKDPQLYKHLQKLQAEDCFFVYRMVVVLFRRELTFEQTLCLWEVIWANQAAIRAGIGKAAWKKGKQRAPPTSDLLLYAISASVLQKRKLIIEKYTGMDDILRECNNMAGHLDVWKLLDDAYDLVAALHNKI